MSERGDDGIIRCPRCEHAAGNICDFASGVTLSCQYCGYERVRDRVRDGRDRMQNDGRAA